MGGRIDEAMWDQRRAWLEKQLQSGFSAARFCRENDLNLNNFNGWKRKFAGGDKVTRRSSGDPTHKAIALLSSAFTQIPIPVSSQAKASTQWIEISLADGVVVRVPSSNLPAIKLVLGLFGSSQETTHA
jgi:hypothetical protein